MDSRHRGAFASRCRRACAHARWRVPCDTVLLRAACSMHRGCVRPAGSRQVASVRKAAGGGTCVRCRYSCDHRIEVTAQPKDDLRLQPVAMFWACPACPWGPGASVSNRRSTGRASRSVKGTALQVMLTMCRLGMAIRARCAAAQQLTAFARTASATPGLVGSTMRAPSCASDHRQKATPEPAIDLPGPTAHIGVCEIRAAAATCLRRAALAACLAGRLCSEG